MTAINVLLSPTAVHVLSDGAGYLPDGTIVSIQSKVLPIAGANAVLAARGYIAFAHLFAERLAAFGSFDELAAGATAAILEVIAHARGKFAPGVLDEPLDLVLAGWSESRDQAEAFALFNHDAYGIPAWELTPIGEGYISPGNADFFERLEEIGLDPLSSDFDPQTDGLRLLEEQRAMRWPLLGGGETIRSVGGFCQLTMVRRDEISSRILKRWPDEVGRKI